MTEKPFKLISGEANRANPAEIARGYVYDILDENPYKDLPFSHEAQHEELGLVLNTIIKDTRNSLPFVKDGILIAVFNIIHLPQLPSGEDNVMGHDRFELRQVKGIIDIYKRQVFEDRFVHELCTPAEKNLLAQAIEILNQQKHLNDRIELKTFATSE